MEMIIGGKKAGSLNRETFKVYNPYTHEVIDEVPAAAEGDLQEALDYAKSNKHVWSEMPLHERTGILLKYADLLEQHAEEIAVLSTKECGKPVGQSMAEITFGAKIVRFYVEKANHLYGKTYPITVQSGYEQDILFTVREPIGVVACIIPFNFPVELYCQKVAPALAAGNAVIIKPASDTPLAAIRMTELMLEAGIPSGAAQIVTGSGSKVGNYLASSAAVDFISFTGSTEIGSRIMECAAPNLTKLCLELGGNDPLIILEDADMKKAVEEAVGGRTYTNGQVCSAPKRFIVQNTIREEFTARLVEKLKSLKVGDPLEDGVDMGPIINEKAAVGIEEKVMLTIRQGAAFALEFERYDKTMVKPCVLTNVTPEMDIAKDMEVFGPVFPIIGFDSVEEAVGIANASSYGLCGGVISEDMNKVFKVATKIQSGSVVINGNGAYRTADMAYGGYKKSGIGREGVSVTLEELTEEKTIVLKKVL